MRRKTQMSSVLAGFLLIAVVLAVVGFVLVAFVL